MTARILRLLATVPLLLAAAGAGAQSTPPPEFTYRAEAPDDGLGSHLANLGDIDGDGASDFAFAAPGDDDVAEGAGQVYIFYGPLDGHEMLGNPEATIRGEAIVDGLGSCVVGVGDVNGDTIGDFVVGARSNDSNGIQAGRLYLFNGPVHGEYAATDADAIISGDAYDELGWSAAAVGDMDGDGHADILVGAWQAGLVGQAHLFLGPLSGEIFVDQATATISGTQFAADLGYAVASGDLNGDGAPDLIVGSPQAPVEGQGTGSVYVFYGPVSGSHPATDADVILGGEAVNDEFGHSLACGDLDGDGQDDLVVGARQIYESNGRAYVFYGPLLSNRSGADADAILLGEAFAGVGSNFSSGLGLPGDVTGDGIGDLLVGAPYADANGTRSGRAYLFHGPVLGTRQADTADAIITGEEWDLLGAAFAPAGDLNGDGHDDFLVGAPQFYGGGGRAWIGLYQAGELTDAPGAGPTLRASLAAYPTPFRDTTVLRGALPAAGKADLRIYDLQGRHVRTLLSHDVDAGVAQATWDGRDDAGRRQPAGIYLAVLREGEAVASRRVVLLR